MIIFERVLDIVKDMDADDVVNLWNEYCRKHRYEEDIIYTFNEDEVNEQLGDYTPFDAMNTAYFGDYFPTADYFKFNGYANIHCMYSTQISDYVDMEVIAEMICDDLDSYILRYEELSEVKSDNEEVEA